MPTSGGGVVEGITDIAAAYPMVTAVVVGVALATVVTALARRSATGAGGDFRDALADCEGGVAVLTHPNPDPDALATGVAVVHLAEAAGVDATLQYPGEIRHQENRALRAVLQLECEPVTHVADIAHEAVVLVDHSEPRGFAGAGGILPYAVVDHHPDGGDPIAETIVDVRPGYGAAASILAEYLADLGAEPIPADADPGDVDAPLSVPSSVATALVYGILTDTDDLVSGASPPDFEAAGYLHPAVDETLLRRIAEPQVSADVMEAKARAVTDRRVRGSFVVSNLTAIPNRDAIPQAADELLKLEGATAAVVCGECDGTVYLSGRSRDDRVDMGRVMRTVASSFRDGDGGGHVRMGGAQIPAEAIESTSLADGGTDGGHDRLVERVFEALSGAE
jgi:nanoRNase/pAp phosphatase (c-di-AMP/oligoRNAs hydrolase)